MSTQNLNPGDHPSSRREEYRVIARRYRPQTFDDLVGQTHVVRGLTSAIQSGRVGHAYLFTGVRGVGKTSVARILAKALNCQLGPTPSPCGTCEMCQSIGGGDDVDVLEIDGASNRGIEEIRQLRQNVNVRPSRARYKIYIIDEVHMLTREAFNALLKTLEEPPNHVKFIFATTEPNKIPLTILSRCQRFDFAGIDAVQVCQRLTQIALAEGIQADPEALEILARRGAGSMRDSQSLLEQLLAGEGGTITAESVHTLLGIAPAGRVSQLVRCLADGDAAGALIALDAALADGVESGMLLDQLMGYLRDIMAAAVGCTREMFLYATAAQADEIMAISARLGLERTLAILQILDQSIARMRAALDGRILAEMAVVRISKLEALDTLPELISELRGAQKGTASTTSPSIPSNSVDAASKKNDNLCSDPLLDQHSSTPNDTPRAPATCSTKTPLEPHTADAVWKQVLERLSAQAELVADQAALADDVATTAPDRLVVSFPAKYTSCKSYCEIPEQQAKLEEALQAVTGQTVRLELRIEGIDAVRLDGPELRPRPPSRRQIQAQVGARPFVRQAMELFDAGSMRVEPPGT